MENLTLYETVMRLVSTDDKQAKVVNAMNELQQSLLRMKVSNMTNNNTEDAEGGGLANLPEIEKYPNRKRLNNLAHKKKTFLVNT